MGLVLMLHSIVRWVIVLVAVVGVARYALILMARASGGRMDRGLMSGYTGLMDLNALLGIIYLVWSGIATAVWFPLQRVEHMVTNLVAVAVAHIFASRGRRAADDQAMARSNLLGLVLSLLLVVIAVAAIGGWSR